MPKNRAMSADERSLIEKMKRERQGKISRTHTLLAQNDIEFARRYDDLFELLMTRDRELTVKQKELIVIGMLAAKGQFGGLAIHIQRALGIGISRNQILEALELAMLYGGADSLIFGADALVGRNRE